MSGAGDAAVPPALMGLAGTRVDGFEALFGRKPRLMLVDDQPINIQTLHQVLVTDCQAQMATSGTQALALCRERQPDLMLLDVQMPGMDGFEVCARLKADARLCAMPLSFCHCQ